MRLISAALAVALTPAFVALPTVSFAAADTPHPVAPKVVSTPISGIDAGAARREAKAGRALATGQASARTVTSDAARSVATSQAARVTTVLTAEQARPHFTVAGISWAAGTDLTADDVTVQVRVREASGWTAWDVLPVPDDGPEPGTAEAVGARLGTTPIVSEGGNGIQVRVDTPRGRSLPDLEVTTIDPGSSPADDDLTPKAPAASASAAAAQPTIITRAQWGADERLRGSKTLSSTIKAITIHHTAGTNDYTPETAAAQVRGIYAYDTQGLGWADIAYNFLVDKWGRVYEGRAGSITEPVRGAHSMGFNTNTMGIAAIGNYETTSAPSAMVDSLAKVAGWKLSQYGVSPSATTQLTSQGGTGAKYAAGVTVTLPTVHAHQNTSYTLCPGKYLYPKMDTIRSKATSYASASAPVSNPTPAPVQTSKLYDAYGKLTLAAGATGWPVRDLQLELNRRGYAVGTADGAFGAKTTTGVSSFQKAAQVKVTGVVSANDWRALSGLSYTKALALSVPARGGFNADGRGDVLGRTRAGDLMLYPVLGSTVGKAVKIGAGWGGFAQVLSPGDWNGDRFSDVLALTGTGDLWLYRGNGRGGMLAGRVLVGSGFKPSTLLVAPGDWTGDGRPDLLARKTNGELWLLTGNGVGGFASTARKIGTGWQIFTDIATPGDVNKDGKPDLIGRSNTGLLYLYLGTGAGTTGTGYRPGQVVSRGWGGHAAILSTGDLTGDGVPDLLARTGTNGTLVYAGNGRGGLLPGRTLATTWAATTRLFGVR
ncbi:hypothetical protein ASD62_04890 [Phycicoccus sp. Root563]|uniref:FG-GAP-like repeat-containing protein n=1 Tax=Phycicoccus sp. Root563 TaxID=1736562 RepID=UPI0007030A60|nr:FG-GAP-like repeat-containing protein [Phycicoccus sp. Root563]KQZ88742.1 hypothetical protein ASD62_04890 [Phycicoccus sp. Root563]